MSPWTWLRSLVGTAPIRLDAAPRWGPADQIVDPGPAQSLSTRYDGASIVNAFTGLGGGADKGSSARPNPCILPLSIDELRILYRHNGLARRLVDLRAQRACRRGWTVPDVGSEDQRFAIPARVHEAMRWADLYGGSLLVPITIDDIPPVFRGNPTAWLAQPLDLARVGRVAALHVFDALEATPLRWDRDLASPTFRLPASWRISSPGFYAEVHASRVVHVRGAPRPPSELQWSTVSTLPDDPYLQAIWDEIRRVTETMNGGAAIAQELRGAVLSLEGLSARMTGDESVAIQTQLELMKLGDGLLGMKVIGTGDKFESYSNAPTGFSDLSGGAWEALSAATGIPQVILTGDSPSGLSSDGESSHEGFRQLISAYQETHRPEIERVYEILYAAQDGPTGGVIPDPAERQLVFAALDEPDEASMAATRLVVAQADVANIGAGVYTAADVARSRFGAEGYSFDLLPVTPPDAEHAGLAAELRGRGGLTALPGLINVGVLTEETAAELLGLPPPPQPDPAEEVAIEAARQAMANPPPAPALGNVATPKTDAADDSVVILIPAAETRLRARAEAAIGQPLAVEDDPHVTVLYVGTGISPEALQEVLEATADAVQDLDPACLLAAPVLRAFPPGSDGTPVVLEYADAYAVQRLNYVLLRALAHVVTAKQFPRYRAHQTLGYAAEPLDPAAQVALLAVDTTVDSGSDAPALRLLVPVSEVQVRVGARVVLRCYPGQPAEVPTPGVPA